MMNINAIDHISQWFLKRPDLVANFVSELHTTIINNFRESINSNSNQDENEAKALEDFLNSIYSSFYAVQIMGGINNMNNTTISDIIAQQYLNQHPQLQRLNLFTSNTTGNQAEVILTELINTSLNVMMQDPNLHLRAVGPKPQGNQMAINLGTEQGLTAIVGEIGLNLSSEIAFLLKKNFESSNYDARHFKRNTLYKWISTRQKVQLVQQKSDIMTVQLEWEASARPELNQILSALSQATISQKTYNINEYDDEGHVLFSTESQGSHLGSFTLGSTQATQSIMHYFTGPIGQSVSKKIYNNFYSTQTLISIFVAAMHLGNYNFDVEEKLSQLSWIYDLIGTKDIIYKNRELAWAELINKTTNGIKFFITIDKSSPQNPVRVLSTKKMILSNMFHSLQHFNGNHSVNAVRMEGAGYRPIIYNKT